MSQNNGMLALGIDLGTSSIKLCVHDGAKTVAAVTLPEVGKLSISTPQAGWAEQNPEHWWSLVQDGLKRLGQSINLSQIDAIGIAYQMHGLVLLDESLRPTRQAIIWCDSRAVEIGDSLGHAIGPTMIQHHLLNHPGNFTISKLAWVARHEPETLAASRWAMLPGDYIATKLTGKPSTSASGLSEMILWDFDGQLAERALIHTGASPSIIPPLVDSFSNQLVLSDVVAGATGLSSGIPITYRAGDQPNNALALGVTATGDVAINAGTSGVIYAIADRAQADNQGKVNLFVHPGLDHARIGALWCLNGAGSSFEWVCKTFFPGCTYEEVCQEASESPVGANGLLMLPYGNGSERSLGNGNPGAGLCGLQFERHSRGDIARACLEGIAFAFSNGFLDMERLGIESEKLKAGHANLFLSSFFSQLIADQMGLPLEVVETDGAQGAARAALAGLTGNSDHLQPQATKATYLPDMNRQEQLAPVWAEWLKLQNALLEL